MIHLNRNISLQWNFITHIELFQRQIVLPLLLIFVLFTGGIETKLS